MSLMDKFNVTKRAASLGGKVFAFAITGFGLSKIWTREDKKEDSFSTKMIQSSAYAMHMGTTTIATAAFFHSGPIAPPVATALVGISSLLMNYTNLRESNESHFALETELMHVQAKLDSKTFRFKHNASLIEDKTDTNNQLLKLEDEYNSYASLLNEVKSISLDDKKQARKNLNAIFTRLKQRDLLHKKRDRTISQYFSKIDPVLFDAEEAIQSTQEKISEFRLQIDSLKEKAKDKNLTAKEKTTLSSLTHKSTHYETINLQCIKYKKATHKLHELEKQLEYLKKNKHNLLKENYYQKKIQKIKKMLSFWQNHACSFNYEHMFCNINLNDLKLLLLSDLSTWLVKNIQQRCKAKSDAIAIQKTKIQKVENEHKALLVCPTEKIQDDFSTMNTASSNLTNLKGKLVMEKFNQNTKRTNLNITTISSLVALLLCLLPKGDTSYLLSTLMLGCGMLGSLSSLRAFYRKNMLAKKIESNETQKVKQNLRAVKLQIAALNDPDMRDLLHTEADKLLQFRETHKETVSLPHDLKQQPTCTRSPLVMGLKKPL